MSLPGTFKPGAWRARARAQPGRPDHAARDPPRRHAGLLARPGRGARRAASRTSQADADIDDVGVVTLEFESGALGVAHGQLRLAEDALAAAVRDRGGAGLPHRLLGLAGRRGARRRDDADAGRRAGRVRGARHAGGGARGVRPLHSRRGRAGDRCRTRASPRSPPVLQALRRAARRPCADGAPVGWSAARFAAGRTSASCAAGRATSTTSSRRGRLHVAFVRSPFAHARIGGVGVPGRPRGRASR